MKKLLLMSALLLGAVTVSQAGGVHLSIGLPLPPLPGISITAPAPVYAPPAYSYAPAYPYSYGPAYPYCGPAYSYGPVYYPPVVSFGFGYLYYGHYHGGGYYGGHYYGGSHSYGRSHSYGGSHGYQHWKIAEFRDLPDPGQHLEPTQDWVA